MKFSLIPFQHMWIKINTCAPKQGISVHSYKQQDIDFHAILFFNLLLVYIEDVIIYFFNFVGFGIFGNDKLKCVGRLSSLSYEYRWRGVHWSI
jgi:hypothetical protein